MKRTLILAGLLLTMVARAQVDPTVMTRINKQAQEIEPRMIEWRRFLHQNPELSNREFKTGKYLADFLKNLGMEVQYPVAKTGAVGILRGGKPGPVIALRADIDGLPVVERNALPFASKIVGL
jgi:metal-dependent amidase/aminoacylase/carboxypeptidase family protein